jgi:hypothetical protein
VSVAAHELPGPVRRLQASGRTLWALVGERDAATLFVLRDGPGEAWQAVRDVDGPLLSLRSHSSGTDLLVLRADPSALLRIGSDGMLLQSWPLPPGRWTGAAWRAAG